MQSTGPAREGVVRRAYRPRLAIDAVAGETCRRLAECLTEGGTIVNYGMLSGQPCMVAPEQI